MDPSANTAICLLKFIYNVIECDSEYYIMAEELYEQAMAAAGKTDYKVVATFKGAELEYIKAQHPFLDRESLIILGDHVTLESGTGCVHTAPGHGVDDFNVCKKYEDIPVVVPVDNRGRMTEQAGAVCAGMTTTDANKAIAKHMEATGSLFAIKKIVHQYPHCWRCKEPVLFRATEQWFCSVESFKEDAIKAIRSVKWMPAWGEERMVSMVRERSDWCVSRQRLWGVPIPIFYCEDCKKPVIERDFINAVSALFRKEGSDGWYKHSADEILPQDAKCPYCGGVHFRKEKDIMDVWFDSGSSHFAVLETRPYLKWPSDLYMEGGDQYRGWFQSSLLTAVACKGDAPIRRFLTHGWTVDGEVARCPNPSATSLSRAGGQGTAPIFCGFGGVDRLRVDVRLSKDVLKQLSEAYRKIRNTPASYSAISAISIPIPTWCPTISWKRSTVGQ